MSWFDDDDAPAPAAPPAPPTPSAFDNALEAIEQFADKAQADFEADPIGFTAQVLGAPKIDIDLDDSDGRMSVKVDGVLSGLSGEWDEAKGTTAEGHAGMDWGAAPLLKGKVAVDADGDLKEISTAAKLTVPVEGVLVSAEETSSLVVTDEGYKASMSVMGGANVDGVDIKGGTHVGYEDQGDHGYKVNFGPDASVGMGTGSLAPGMDIAEGELKVSTDFSFGETDGQTTIGVRETQTASGKVFGQTVASVQSSESVQYTTGPQGEELIVSGSVEGTVGSGPLTATGKATATWETGTDAGGNDIDRVTFTDSGTATAPLVGTAEGGDTVTFDDATGVIDEVDVVELLDEASLEVVDELPFELQQPDYQPEVTTMEIQIEEAVYESTFDPAYDDTFEQSFQPEVMAATATEEYSEEYTAEYTEASADDGFTFEE